MCPCHRCLVSKSDLSTLGAPIDVERSEKERSPTLQALAIAEVRKEILQSQYAVDSLKVEMKLKPQSLIPVEVC